MTRVRAIRCGTVNCCLLLGGRGSVPVDTGLPGSLHKLERLLAGDALMSFLSPVRIYPGHGAPFSVDALK
ncbi:hypothetical protein [Harryflintia acetispora]|uniref:Uncharacterized protein n=1 Tax=Harryflintia acetispora TaxID=1849041 RepID=A0A9X8UIL2_9FIRM|nr:hypothetical protein [Harryflintia acetispora]TCL42286.1 hypothetical protein EDD78_11150 [Harryflintia acetispora]